MTAAAAIAAYVARLESDLKAGAAHDLGPCTLVLGANAAGKSGVVASLELALTGRCGDAGATGAAVLELASGVGATVRASLSDGRGVAYSVRGSTAKASKPLWSVDGTTVAQPIGAMLASEVADLLSRDAKRQREALVSICCGAVDLKAVARNVPDVFRPEWTRRWEAARAAAGNDADALVALAEQLRADLRAARSTVRAGGGGERPAVPSLDEIAELRRKLDAARAAGRLPALREHLEAVRARQAEAEASSAASSADAESARALANALRQLDLVISVVKEQVDARRCWSCGHAAPEDGWPARLAKIEQRRAEIHAQFKAVAPALLGPKMEIDRAVELAEHELAGAEMEARDGVAADAPALDAQLREVEAAIYAEREWEAKRAATARAEAQVTVLGALCESADRAIADVLGGALAAFCLRAANIAFPGGGRPAIQLFDGNRQVCRVGLQGRVDGPIRSWRALSGAERTTLIAALACAWGAGRSEAVRLVVVDDVWLGREALEGLCAGLRAAVKAGAITQAVVCALDNYGLDLPGWLKARVGA